MSQIVKLHSDMGKHVECKIQLRTLDDEIEFLERQLELRNEQRRELINYLGLNKPQPKK